jgi:hypothetical protein
MAAVVFDFYNGLLGTDFARSRRFDLQALGLPTLPLEGLEEEFSEEEVRAVIHELPSDKAPAPDGFMALFYKSAWDIIKHDILRAFRAFWSLDARSFHHLNDAYMVLLKKKGDAAEIKDYRPISLIHSFGKLITKCLARDLASVIFDEFDQWCLAGNRHLRALEAVLG